MNDGTAGAKRTRGGIALYSFAGLMALGLTVAGEEEHLTHSIGPLIAALAAGACLFRFGTPWKRLDIPLQLMLLVLAFVLVRSGHGWWGGTIAGAGLGTAWRLAVATPRAKARWTVDDQGFSTITEARAAARKALHALEGAPGRLVVGHGTARFEVTGSLPAALTCHRTHDADADTMWAVLSRPGQDAAPPVDVPTGPPPRLVPSTVVHGLAPVEAALEDFLKYPTSRPQGSEWATGERSSGLRLGS